MAIGRILSTIAGKQGVKELEEFKDTEAMFNKGRLAFKLSKQSHFQPNK
jgi:hypothetical protein